MTTIKGDLLDLTEGIICHQVNCQRVAGAGLALQIRNKWPEWYDGFLAYTPRLGDAMLWAVEPKLIVASLYAQKFYGKGLQTNYFAFDTALLRLRQRMRESYFETKQVYMPYGIGCGLAGGDWNVIEPLIEKYFPNAIIVEKP